MLTTAVFTQVIGKGPNLVLLHGWGVYSVVWELLVQKLAKSFTVTLVDLPGYGRSHFEGDDYCIENICTSLLPLLPEKAIWLGWSMGGLIATHVAINHPERVKKLVAVGSTPHFIQDLQWPGMKLKILQEFAKQLSYDYEATVMRFLLLQFHGTHNYRSKIQWLEKNLFVFGKPKIEVLLGGLQLLESLDLRQKLATLQCETLYVFGRLDALVPAQVSESIKMLNKNLRSVVLAKASHALFLSHEDEFLNLLRNFLDE